MREGLISKVGRRNVGWGTMAVPRSVSDVPSVSDDLPTSANTADLPASQTQPPRSRWLYPITPTVLSWTPPSSLPFHSDVPQALVSPVMLSLLWRLWVGGMREASKSVFLSQKQKKTEQNNAHCLGPISSVQESPEVWRTGRAGALSWVMGYGIMVGHRESRAIPRLSSHCR